MGIPACPDEASPPIREMSFVTSVAPHRGHKGAVAPAKLWSRSKCSPQPAHRYS